MGKSGFIAIAGRPNAGKSTLLNRVLRAKVSIVTPKAQTTRERVLGILTDEARGQIVFVDTPGIHRARPGGINAYMIHEARQALEDVSAVWYLVDPGSRLEHEEAALNLLSAARAPVFVLLNKADLVCGPRPVTVEAQVADAARARGINVVGPRNISAARGTGVEDLLGETWALLPEGPAHYPDPEQLSDRPTRFFVAEKIREQLLLQLGEELPYSCAVEIAKFDEEAEPPRIEAVIHVERDSQKGMVVGQGGRKIKAIGSAARREVEEFLGQHVFLGLRVSVLKDWSRDAAALRRLGYELPKERGRR
jgi:GTP-binding protein Era